MTTFQLFFDIINYLINLKSIFWKSFVGLRVVATKDLFIFWLRFWAISSIEHTPCDVRIKHKILVVTTSNDEVWKKDDEI